MKLSISSCLGKMGQAILQEAILENIKITSLISNKHLGESIDSVISTKLDLTIESKINQESNVAIDFSLPEPTLDNLKNCTEFNIPIIIGTTGFTEAQMEEIEFAAKKIPVLYAPNTSIGMNMLFKLASIAKKLDAEVNIVDIHHKHKRDTPSGTAKKILELLEDKNPSCNSIRIGEIIGEHTVSFVSDYEQIKISHTAFDRKVFASGALKAAKWLQTKSPGLYTMQDMLD